MKTEQTKLKRYLSFFGDCYYPSGGMEDLLCDFDSASDAIAACEKLEDGKMADRESQSETICVHPKPRIKRWDSHWAHVYDLEEKKIFWSSHC